MLILTYIIAKIVPKIKKCVKKCKKKDAGGPNLFGTKNSAGHKHPAPR